MSNILEVENVFKRFWIGGSVERGARHLLEKTLRNPLSIFQKIPRKEFWALQDINFSLEPGQKLGIVGRNGAGKSTLLKLISRITLPSQGNIKLRGRVGSLLEVGTGFHPELTGRENIFLNGALLGMSRQEIAKNFDAIVDFAEIAEFIETPVKHYSSGMYVRLAFAVAAHLQTEILIVDEVLAVGDSRFQKKCIEKMNEAGRVGRTVLFVSHNLSLIQSVCTHGLLLDQGRQLAFGGVTEVLNAYQKRFSQAQSAADGFADLASLKRTSGKSAILQRAKIAQTGSDVQLSVEAKLPADARRELNLVVRVSTDLGTALFTLSSLFEHKAIDAANENFRAQAKFVWPNLREGMYLVSLELYSRDTLMDEVTNALNIEMPGAKTNHSYALPAHFGPMIVNAHWSTDV